MMAEPNYRSLFYDHVHPNDKGYEIVANQWFKAITEAAAPRTATTMAPFIEKKDYGEPPPLGPGEE
jgi:lysophospholipase L1-like esterase